VGVPLVRWVLTWWGLGLAIAASAQEPRAVSLPDGTIVLYSATGQPDPNAPIDGVRLSAKDYADLVEKAREATQPIPPAECTIAWSWIDRTDGPAPALTITSRIRTSKRDQAVWLSLKGAIPTGIRVAGASKHGHVKTIGDGLAIVLPEPGDTEVTVEADVVTTLRAASTERGFDLGLPGAVLTNVTPAVGPHRALTLVSQSKLAGQETIRVAGGDRTTIRRLGNAESLTVTWPAKLLVDPRIDRMTADATVIAGETDAAVRTTIGITTSKESVGLVLPPEAVVRAVDSESLTKVERGTNLGEWRIVPANPGTLRLVAEYRIFRPKDGRIALGPYRLVGSAELSGRVRITMPVSHRIIPDSRDGLVAIDPGEPLLPDDPPVDLAFEYRTPAADGTIFAGQWRTIAASLTGRATLRATLGDRIALLKSSVRLTPRNREVREIVATVPAVWSSVRVGPDELVDEVVSADRPDGRRSLTIRLARPYSDAFELTFDSQIATAWGTTRRVELPLVQLTDATLTETRVTIVGAEDWEIQASSSTANLRQDLVEDRPGPRSNRNTLTGTIAGPFDGLTVTGKPDPPPLDATSVVELAVQERQTIVRQSIQLRSTGRHRRAVRLTGSAATAGLRTVPAAVPLGPGDLEIPWPATGNDLSIVLHYSLPRSGRREESIVPISVESATTATTTIHAWGPPGTRFGDPEGHWMIEPPRPIDGRESLPWLSMTAASRYGEPPPKWTPAIEAVGEGDPADVVVESSAVAIGRDRTVARYLISQWPPTGFDVTLNDDMKAELALDGRKFEMNQFFAGSRSSPGFATYRIVPGEGKAGKAGIVLQIRWPTRQGIAPQIERASFARPTTWLFEQPADRIVLAHGTPLNDWSWRADRGGLAAHAIEIDPRLANPDGDWPKAVDCFAVSTIARQPWHVSLPAALVIVFATAVASIGLVIVWNRRSTVSVAVIAIVVAFALVAAPAITKQLLAAGQTSVVFAPLLLVLQRWQTRRLQQLPGFSRIVEPASRATAVAKGD
jgi:hypothetical protein